MSKRQQKILNHLDKKIKEIQDQQLKSDPLSNTTSVSELLKQFQLALGSGTGNITKS
jgi:hypothetical protein